MTRLPTPCMKHPTISPNAGAIHQLREQIAAVAARYVAEDGATYANAKQKAAQQVMGGGRISSDAMPDNDQVEQQVLAYHQLFNSASQPQRLRRLRAIALATMQDLAAFDPHLTGAVLSGSAGAHDDIVLQLFVDNDKDVAIYLLNKGIRFDVAEAPGTQSGRQDPVEMLSFERDGEGIHLVLLDPAALRSGHVRKQPRADIAALTTLIEESESP